MREKSQHCSEGAQGSGKQNEERKLFFGVNGEFMMTWQKFSVSVLSACWVRMKQMSLLQGIGDETKCCKRHGISVKRLFSFASWLHTLVTVILGLPRIKGELYI